VRKQPQISLSLGLKFVLLVVLVFTITLSINTYVKIQIETKEYSASLINKGKLLSKMVALMAPEAIFAYDFNHLNDYVKNISAQSEVLYCAIKDQEDKFLTSYFDSSKPGINSIVASNPGIKLAEVIKQLKNNPNVIMLDTPIEYEGNQMGSVLIGISKYKFKQTIQATLYREVISEIIMLIFLSAVIFYIFKYSTLKRIKELKSCAEEVAKGDFSYKAHIGSHDEIGILATEFNTMIDNLEHNVKQKEQAFIQITELNASLEQKVYERTVSIENVNIELEKQKDELKSHKNNLEELVHEKTKDLVLAKDVAEKANRSKSDFLANMSHELRTPMHAILSFSKFGLLKYNKVEREKLKCYFENINQSGTRLLSLLNALLDLAKLETGREDLKFTKTNINLIAKSIIKEFESLTFDNNLKIKHIFESAEQLVECDAEKIGQVIRNLIGNALKFTPPGKTITLQIKSSEMIVGKRTTDKKYYRSVKVKIIDEGIGIPENELGLVFDKFAQSSKTITGAGGTGLGLAICSEIIKKHHGEIYAENNSVEGATFIFEFPVEINNIL